MQIELVIIAVIIVYIFIVNGKIEMDKATTNKFCNLIKEKDYDFLLIAKYGDRVYDPNEVFMKRVKRGVIVSAVLIFFFLTEINYIGLVISLVIGYLIYKSQYFSLKKWYKAHLNYIDSLLPYYLKSLEVLIHHYTVPVSLARSIEEAPEVFKDGLKRLVKKIEAGDSSIDPYMEFAKEYPVRDSMRMMRLLYRLSIGSQENKHEQLVMFSRSVSALQNKARETRYKERLNKMENQTMVMLGAVGGSVMVVLLFAMLQQF